MITKLGKILLLICPVVFSSACIKIQVKPKDVISDTVTAGKDLYTTIKRKKDGTEERVYTHTIALADSEAEPEMQVIADACLDQLTATVENASEKKVQILEAGTEVVESDDGNKMKCTMRAVL